MTAKKIEFRDLPVEYLKRGRYQPRRDFNQQALEELAQSLRSNGLIEPLVVRPIKKEPNTWEIIAGERRWRAAQLAGFDTLPCLIRECGDEEAAELAIIENIQREDLNPIEEARAFQQLADDFGYLHEEIADSVGKSRTQISNMLRLLNLDTTVQELLIQGKLSSGHGKILAGLPSHQQGPLAERCAKEGWTVRRLEGVAKRVEKGTEDPAGAIDPNLKALEAKLASHVGTPVAIGWNDDGRGEVKIRFHNLDILEGIFQRMGFRFEEK